MTKPHLFLKKNRFVIIGLGLMGGSLGLALRSRFPKAEVIGVSRRRSTIQYAKRKGILHAGFTDLKSALRRPSVVFICTPVDTVPNYLKQIDALAPAGTLVTDVGSTKAEIVRWTDQFKFKNIIFVGSHPMAGSHLRGPEHAVKNLYKNALIFVVRTKRTDIEVCRYFSKLWHQLDGRVVVLSPDRHDQIVSEISHLPHSVSVLLTNTAASDALKYAASGFRDMTRIAAGDARIWTPILISNRKNLLQNLKLFRANLDRFMTDLRGGRVGRINKRLKQAADRQSALRP